MTPQEDPSAGWIDKEGNSSYDRDIMKAVSEAHYAISASPERKRNVPGSPPQMITMSSLATRLLLSYSCSRTLDLNVLTAV